MLSYYCNHIVWLHILSLFTISWAGFACLNNPCIHGVCIDDLNTTYSCYCIDGYTGIQCQTNWDECWSNPCQNGGTCHDGVATFNCSCPEGFIGSFCEQDFNECDSNPCMNNGSCIDLENGYLCKCQPGYSGDTCETDVAVCNATNETVCANGGTCEEGPGITFTCKCQAGWGGLRCESEINECTSAPCQNGAVCIDMHADYACACLFGYTGKNCEEIVLHCEDNPCKNGALCLMEYGLPVCYCVPDFHGDQCQFQYDECQLGPRCRNGGTCIDGLDSFMCSCPPNLTGVLCECLILSLNELDCTYIAPNIFTTTAYTVSTSETVTETSIYPNFSITVSDVSRVPNISTVTSIATSEIVTLSISTTTELELYPTLFSETSTSEETTTESFTIMPQTEETAYSVISESSDFTTIPLTVSDNYSIHATEETFTTIFNDTLISTVTLTTQFFTEVWQNLTTFGIVTPTKEIPITTELEFSTTVAMELTPIFTNETRQSASTTDVSEFTTFFTEEPVSQYITMKTELTSYETSTLVESTTLGRENRTTIIVDCSKPGIICMNGGTCIYLLDGSKCMCPYDAEGPLCEVSLGIKNAAFGGNSYLTHRLINTSHISIEFLTKTLSLSGLIFYLDIDSKYMALYLEEGYLKFIFSCGYQTMLLWEFKNPVNDGNTMKVQAGLEFSKDFKYCNATVRVNNTLSMSGNQVAVVNQVIKPVSKLHLGGIPQESFKEHLPYSGFLGCISDLKISGKSIEVFKDAEDGFKVSECSSLVCLSNPCNHGGTCSEDGDNWHCHCKNGYLGKSCEHSVCDNNPCLFGATCVPFTGSGYICLCPYGKHGHFCESDLEISETYFSSSMKGFSSYAAYPIPLGGTAHSMELKFKFAPSTMEQISILIFIGQADIHDALSDHIAVSFVKGYIMLTWNLGSGPRRIFTSKPLMQGNVGYYTLQFGRVGRRAWLSVDNLGNVTGRSPGNLSQLDVVPILYLGGHNSPNFSTLPHDLPLHSGFSGCIFDVELKSGNLVIPLQSSRPIIGRALGQCGTTECHENLCQNNGACLYHGGTFTCMCQDGWFGPLCSSRFNPCDQTLNNCSSGSTCVPLLSGYECDCPIGKTGRFCEKHEKLSDVSLSGKRSYIELKPSFLDNSKFTIEIQIRPLSNRGLILFIGLYRNTFLSLVLHSGLLELRILSAKHKLHESEILLIRSNKLLALGIWYTIRIGKFGNKMYLFVDNVINTGILSNGDILGISSEILYLGGLPDISDLPSSATAALPTPFTGCIRQVILNMQHIPLTLESITNGRNIADCDGTPCGGDACEHGGTCWLDSELQPHCSCLDPYVGEKCENIPSCKDRPCHNKGRCANTRCICSLGFTGVFCETAIKVRMPEFLGSSHLILKKSVNDKKRDVTHIFLQHLQINFTTVELYGLLLWSSKAEHFIGIGIENGYIKLVYSVEYLNKTTTMIPQTNRVTDGLWHNLELSFLPSGLHIQLDYRILETHENYQVHISRDNVFYLGGIPATDFLLKTTYGFFNQSFVGCIGAITFNNEKSVTDFSAYEGEDINVCRLV